MALLALLARAPAYRLTREKLIGYLWPESRSDRARHTLRETVHVLRRDLSAGVLDAVGDDLRLDLKALSVDAVEFEQAFASGELSRAAELYGGPFLDGFYLDRAVAFERWVDGERGSLARAYRGALEALARDAQARGQLRESVDWWSRLATEAPYDASVAVALMQALAHAGDRAEALKQAEAHAALLREDFGAVPSPEVEELAKQLRASPPRGPGPRASRDTSSARQPTSEPGPPAALAGPAATRVVGTVGRKPPRRSPSRQRRLVLAAGVLAVAAAGIFAIRSGPSDRTVTDPSVPLDSKRVLVLPFENQTGDASLAPLGLMAADWISQELTGTGLVKVVPLMAGSHAKAAENRDSGPEDVSDQDRDPVAFEAARTAGAGIVISGVFYGQGDSLALQARLVDAATGELLSRLERVVTSRDEPSEGLDELRRRTAGALASILDPRLERWAETSARPPSFEAYRLFATGVDLHLRGRFSEAVEPFFAAAEHDSTFTMPLVWAAMALGNTGNSRDGERADSLVAEVLERRSALPPLDVALLEAKQASGTGDYRGRYEAMRRAVDLAPRSEWLYLFGQAALNVRRPHEALNAFVEADPEMGWLADWTPYWRDLANARHRTGDYEGELSDLRRAMARVEARGGGLGITLLRPEIRALAALGWLEELNEALDRYIATWNLWPTGPGEVMMLAVDELRTHGHAELAASMATRMLDFYEGLTAEQQEGYGGAYLRHYGSALYTAGRWEQAQSAYRFYLERGYRPSHYIDGRLGIIAARMGDRHEALGQLALLDDLPDDPNIRNGSRPFWKAAILAHLGELDRAVALLRQAFVEGLGYTAGAGDLHVYPNHDLEPLRGYPPFEELMKPKG